jgi:CRP-like cAMP-binding protein
MTGGPAANLDGIRLLAPLSAAERAALAARCSWRRFRRGELVLSRDSDCREVLFIVAGRLRVLNFAASGREVAYATIEAGSQVGELAALDGEPRSASVEALDECLIAALPSGPFHELLLGHGELAVALLKNMARIIRRTDERIAELSVLGAMQRVYRELLRLGQPQPDGSVLVSPLPTQENLAALAGTTRETVARALGQLAKLGVARRRGRELSIPDPARLEALSEPEG